METEVKSIEDVVFGEELPVYLPDTSLKKSAEFATFTFIINAFIVSIIRND